MNKLKWLNAQEERLNLALEENQRRREFLENELQVIRELKQEGESKMNNFDALKQMPLKPFANMAFDVARNKCETLEDFEKFLESEVPEDLKPVLKGALQNMQCPNAN